MVCISAAVISEFVQDAVTSARRAFDSLDIICNLGGVGLGLTAFQLLVRYSSSRTTGEDRVSTPGYTLLPLHIESQEPICNSEA